ncbi:hypothetical protein B2J93_4633 [Marssonina coronariae]|uniref:BTB domain-containing protein n=1 Tax=Diplocarpon coronariae TaxID=2795749 RepID=A0A218Z1W6_9HELO|nr:hypothetical protein B2J93_4633 [Marssonina coronariae]
MPPKKRKAQEMDSRVSSAREPGGYPQDVYDAYHRDMRGAGLRGGDGFTAVEPGRSADNIQAQPSQPRDQAGRIWQRTVDGVHYQVAGPVLNPQQEQQFQDQLQAERRQQEQARQKSLTALQERVEGHGRVRGVKQAVVPPQAHQPVLRPTSPPAGQPSPYNSQQPACHSLRQPAPPSSPPAPFAAISPPAGQPLPQPVPAPLRQTPPAAQPLGQSPRQRARALAEILRAAHSRSGPAPRPAGQLPSMPLPANMTVPARQCLHTATDGRVEGQGVSDQDVVRKNKSRGGANGRDADADAESVNIDDQDPQANIDPALKTPIQKRAISKPKPSRHKHHQAPEAATKSAQIRVVEHVNACAKSANERHSRAAFVAPGQAVLNYSAGRSGSSPQRNISLSMQLANPANGHRTIALDWDLAFFHSPVIARHFSSDAPEADYRDAATIKVRLLPTAMWFSHWLYTQSLYPRPLSVESPVSDEQTLLVDLYLLAESLEIPRLQNLCLRELSRVHDETKTLSIEASSLLYTYSDSRCRLRAYLVWRYATRLSSEQIVDGEADRYYSPQMMLEWIVLLTSLLRGKEAGEKLAGFQLAWFLVQEKEMIWPFLDFPGTDDQEQG